MEEMIFAAEAALLLKVSVKTIQRWDREKKLVANRTVTGRRWYTKAQLEKFQHGNKPAPTPILAIPIAQPPPTGVKSNTPAPLAPIASPASAGAKVITDPDDANFVPDSEEQL